MTDTVNTETSATEPITEVSTDSKKRKADSSLSDLKRTQLAEARQKKQQKAAQREAEMDSLRSKLNAFEGKLSETQNKLNDTDQKLTNAEVDKQIQVEIASPEKRQKVVTADTDVKPKSERPAFLENLFNPENVMRTAALASMAAGSYYFKNVWRVAPPKLAPPKPDANTVAQGQSLGQRPTSEHALKRSREAEPVINPIQPLSLFPQKRPVASLFRN